MQISRSQKILKNIDYSLVLAAVAIIGLGLLTIASATQATSLSPDTHLDFVWRQLLGIFIGAAAFFFFLYWRYEDIIKYVPLLYWVNLAALFLVLIIGYSAGGAQRWVQIGPFLFQPSEFAKLVVIVGLAAYLIQRQDQLFRLKEILKALAYVGLPALLVLAQPDLGTALVFLAIALGMLFVAGARPLWLGALLFGGLGTVASWIWLHLRFDLWMPLQSYQLERLIVFLDPWKDWQGAGYHVIQSQIAIGAGGLFGRGLFNGSQNQLNFLPEQHTDFIFSVFAEELGFVGVAILLGLFFVVIYRGIQIAAQAKDEFGTLLAAGIVSMLAFHVMTNVGMAAGIMPVTGLPLPLFSYGPSSMVITMAALGLLNNVWLRRQMIIF